MMKRITAGFMPIFTDESDPLLAASNARVRKWGLAFVTIKPEALALLPDDSPRRTDQTMRVYEVSLSEHDEVHVYWSNPQIPWQPYHAWMWCADLIIDTDSERDA